MPQPGVICFATVCLLAAVHAAAGQQPPVAAATAPAALGEPPAPLPPATINRDASGRATIRAVRIDTPLKIDGRLDEAVYQQIPPMAGFIQNDPKEGAPASEPTDVWILYDRDNIYVVARCWQSASAPIIANERRRDNVNIGANDHFSWGFDTFHDRRNVDVFYVTPVGGRQDAQVTNEHDFNPDWNPIWDAKAARFDGGFVVEAAIPFKSLRYKPGATVWGFQARRTVAAKNEISYLTPIPASAGKTGVFFASLAATLTGIEPPAQGLNLDVKPYVTSNLTTDRTVSPKITNDPGGAVGLDAKYGLSQGVAADLTINTDFAQVEADEQQVNLTRFSLFFPEKRDFFLENAGIFNFASAIGALSSVGDAPVLFYSRTIGLSNGREVPIRAGGRVSGRAGPWTIGLVNVQTGDNDVLRSGAANFSVVRVRRDVLGHSSVGAMFTNRSVGDTTPDASQGYGLDAAFAFGSELTVNGYFAKTHNPTISADDTSYRGLLTYSADRYGAQLEHLLVGPGFQPGLGFARRRDLRKDLVMLRFSPRPKKSTVVRKYLYSGTFTNIDNTSGRLETQLASLHAEAQLQNSDIAAVEYNYEYEFLPASFSIAPGVSLPSKGYAFNSRKVSYTFGTQRKLAGTATFEQGTFYDGDRKTFTLTSGRFAVLPQFTIEPGVTINTVTLKEGAFTQRLVTSRVTYTMSPLMFASALLQYNSTTRTVAANVRFRWEYQPGSELFLVYNEQRDTLSHGFPDLANRAFIVKINRVFRF